MWKEAGQTSAEDSYFIPYTGGNFEGFKDWAVDMAKRYNQYSVLISDGEGEIAYYDQQGNVTDDNGIPDEFKDIKFSNDTIDKNIDQAGAGGYTRLKGTDKRFQLQKEDYDPIFYKSTSRNSSTVNKKFAELAKLDDVGPEYPLSREKLSPVLAYFVNSALEAPAFNDSVYSGNCSDIAQEISMANDTVTFTFITDAFNSTYSLIFKHNELANGAVTYSNFELEKQEDGKWEKHLEVHMLQ